MRTSVTRDESNRTEFMNVDLLYQAAGLKYGLWVWQSVSVQITLGVFVQQLNGHPSENRLMYLFESLSALIETDYFCSINLQETYDAVDSSVTMEQASRMMRKAITKFSKWNHGAAANYRLINFFLFFCSVNVFSCNLLLDTSCIRVARFEISRPSMKTASCCCCFFWPPWQAATFLFLCGRGWRFLVNSSAPVGVGRKMTRQ